MIAGGAIAQSPIAALPLAVRASSRAITAAMIAALEADPLRPFLACKFGTAGGEVRAWSGLGDLTIDGDVYQGVGGFYGTTPAEETTELAARGIKLSLTGVPSDLIAIAVGQVRQRQRATVYLGALEAASRAVVADPYAFFVGLTDAPEIDRGPDDTTIALAIESRLIDLKRPHVRRFTTEDQQIVDATDRGFEYVPGLQDVQFKFGRG